MVIIKLQGGLGNQMFQYALGRKLELAKQKKVRYDFDYFEHQGHRPYELYLFGLSLKRANKIDLLSSPISGNSFVNKFKTFYHSVFRIAQLRQLTFSFDPRFLEAPDNAYLEGYWQTEKYFSDIRDKLIREFSFKNSVTKENQKYRDRILNFNSVSVHFRRGDYLTDPNNLFQVCNWAYYVEAIQIMAGDISTPYFFIFSDDPEWCKKNITLDQPFEIVDVNTKENSHLDMYLMSQCRHNIIANSSFSWWAAWLNQHADKRVIAPKNWFSDKTINTIDIIPQSWRVI
jgi:hypothetical protein